MSSIMDLMDGNKEDYEVCFGFNQEDEGLKIIFEVTVDFEKVKVDPRLEEKVKKMNSSLLKHCLENMAQFVKDQDNVIYLADRKGKKK